MNYIPESLNLPQYYRSKTLVTTNCLFQTLLFRLRSFPDCLDRVDPSEPGKSNWCVCSLFKIVKTLVCRFFSCGPSTKGRSTVGLSSSPSLPSFPKLNLSQFKQILSPSFPFSYSKFVFNHCFDFMTLLAHHCMVHKAPFLSLSLSKPCWLREPLNKEKALKTQFCILGNYCSFLPWSCQTPKSLPKSSAFDHTWAHVQFVADTSSPLMYNL